MPACGCTAIDVHTHVVPARLPAYPGRGRGRGWPSVEPAATACHRQVVIDGAVYRTVTDAAADPALRLPDMDAMGVHAQVLSPMPELLSCWLEPADAAMLLRFVNEEIAGMVATDPARLHGLGAVPLQDMDLALRELEHVVRGLGLAGVEIPGNVEGTAIGDARFDPFWEACADLGACVFVHPLRPAGMDRLVGPKALQQVLAFPTESGLAAASLLTGGVLERHAGLRIAFSHGAGTLPALLPRLQHGWMRTPAVRQTMGTAPAELARRLYVDSLVYDARMLRLLVDLFGPTQVLVGSDYPFNIREHEPVQRVLDAGLPPADVELLLSRNARRWLGLEPP